MSMITLDYQGHSMVYQDDGWFNATQAAAKYGKRPNDWLSLQSTKDYIEAFKRHNPEVKKTHFTKKGGDTITGNSGNAQIMGTWLHPKLAVAFARWLDSDFAVWCDSKIDGLIHKKDDWRKLRHASAGGYKLASDILKMVRADSGKDTEAKHYMCESKLVNWALTGEFKGIDRDGLDADQLDKLAYLQERNAVLIGRGLPYEQRKPMIAQYAKDWNMKALDALAKAQPAQKAA